MHPASVPERKPSDYRVAILSGTARAPAGKQLVPPQASTFGRDSQWCSLVQASAMNRLRYRESRLLPFFGLLKPPDTDDL